eukprot:2282351-Prymnesium_polylepis.1
MSADRRISAQPELLDAMAAQVGARERARVSERERARSERGEGGQRVERAAAAARPTATRDRRTRA